jgi:hypothetical protein
VYAIVSWWQLPERNGTESVLELEPAVAALARQQPDFVSAFWTYERSNGKSIGFLLMQSDGAAHVLRNAIEAYMEARPASPVKLEVIRIQHVVGHLASTGIQAEAIHTKTSPGEVESRV